MYRSAGNLSRASPDNKCAYAHFSHTSGQYPTVASLPLPGAVGASEGGFLRMFTLLFGPERLMPALLLSRGISFYGFLMISALVTAVVHLTAGRRPVAAPRRPLSGLTKPKRRPEPL